LKISIGIFFLILGMLVACYAVIGKFFGHEVLGWASTLITIVMVGGFQMIFISLLGEYVTRIFDETKNRPNYIVNNKEQ